MRLIQSVDNCLARNLCGPGKRPVIRRPYAVKLVEEKTQRTSLSRAPGESRGELSKFNPRLLVELEPTAA